MAPTTTGSIAPLYREDRSVATNKEEQAQLMFFGTLVSLTDCNLKDIHSTMPPPLGPFPIIPPYEVEKIVSNLPTRKAKGPDDVPNKLLKIAKSDISFVLAQLFNYCLKTGF